MNLKHPLRDPIVNDKDGALIATGLVLIVLAGLVIGLF